MTGASPRFTGFPSRPQATAIPYVFFSDVLPQLRDGPSLGIVLFALHFISRKSGFPRYITAEEIAAEPAVQAFAGAEALPTVQAGLRQAVDACVLLPVTAKGKSGPVELYFLNAPADRRARDAVRSGGVDLGPVIPLPATERTRAGVYALYESLVGSLSPLIADELAEAERLYPAEWLEAAFREAAAQNARSWRYVSRILERWSIEGRHNAKTAGDPPADERYFRGKYGRILRKRLRS